MFQIPNSQTKRSCHLQTGHSFLPALKSLSPCRPPGPPLASGSSPPLALLALAWASQEARGRTSPLLLHLARLPQACLVWPPAGRTLHSKTVSAGVTEVPRGPQCSSLPPVHATFLRPPPKPCLLCSAPGLIRKQLLSIAQCLSVCMPALCPVPHAYRHTRPDPALGTLPATWDNKQQGWAVKV